MKKWMIRIGLVLILAAIGLTAYNLLDSLRANQSAGAVAEQLSDRIKSPPQQAVPEYLLFPEKEMPVVEIDGEGYVGYLEIPRLGLHLPVAAGEFDMKKLQKTPAVFCGTPYRNDMVIAAHNYRSHFGRLNRLDVGDLITFTDVDGNVFQYKVSWSERVSPSDYEQMVSAGQWDLSLFTCTYNKEYRFTLRCMLVEEE